MGLDWVLVVEEDDGTASRSGHEHQQLSLVSAEKQSNSSYPLLDHTLHTDCCEEDFDSVCIVAVFTTLFQ